MITIKYCSYAYSGCYMYMLIIVDQNAESKLTGKCLVTDCFGELYIAWYTVVTLVPQVPSFSSVAQ